MLHLLFGGTKSWCGGQFMGVDVECLLPVDLIRHVDCQVCLDKYKDHVQAERERIKKLGWSDTQLDRIEQKLDRLLALLQPVSIVEYVGPPPDPNVVKAAAEQMTQHSPMLIPHCNAPGLWNTPEVKAARDSIRESIGNTIGVDVAEQILDKVAEMERGRSEEQEHKEHSNGHKDRMD